MNTQVDLEKRNRHGFPMVAKLRTESGAHVTAKIVQIFNSPLPWIVILAAFAFIAFGMVISQQARLSDLSARFLEQQSRYEERVQSLRADFVDKLAEVRKSAIDKEREVRMLEYYVVQTDSKLVTRGVLKQSETWSAKEGKQ